MSEKIFGKSCRNTFCVFSGFLCEKRFTQRREGRGVCPYMRKRCTQKSQKTTEFASHVSAKVCAVCVWQFFSAGFCVFRGFCVRPPHAEPRRLCETLRLCVRRKYLFQSKTLHTEITENHRILLRMLLRNFAPLREKKISLSVNSGTQNTTEFCSACFCGSLRCLRETITLRTHYSGCIPPMIFFMPKK